MTDTRPLLTLERNSGGRLFIGVTEFDAAGYGIRAFVLSYQCDHVADSVMERRFADMARLMGDTVRSERIDSA